MTEDSKQVATVDPNDKPGVVAKRIEMGAGGSLAAIIPQDAEQAFRLAQMVHQAGLAPKDMNSPQKIVTSILAGMEIGLPPMQSIQSIAVINGRPSLWGDAVLGLVQGSGLLADIEETIEGNGDERVAICRAKRTDRPTEIIRTFSVADAKKAHLWSKKGPWQDYPQRMMQLRARGFCLRDGWPDVLKGIGFREEVRDFNLPGTATTQVTHVTKAEILDQGKEAPAIEHQQEGGAAETDDMPEEEFELYAKLADEMGRAPNIGALNKIVQAHQAEADQCGEAFQAAYSAIRTERVDQLREVAGNLV